MHILKILHKNVYGILPEKVGGDLCQICMKQEVTNT